ncbi:MAG: hypothetical protein KAT43_04330 [Nanoarchaeota archaeon]|nr:hypothetical protein [Nanoarchaeota archaeon]
MRKLKKYIGIGLLCISSALASCENKTEEPKVVFDKETNQSYLVVNRELRGAFNEFIRPHNKGIIRYSSYPGWMRTSVYDNGKRIHVQFFNGSSEKTGSIDDVIDSEKVRDYRVRFERDKDLLKQAGLIK